jgi:hypothetical protein
VLSGAGVLVPAGEPAALARAVDALLADPARRRLLGHAARQRAVRQCSLDRSVGAILALWQDLGASPAASTAASAPPAGESRCLPPAQESHTVPPVPETHKRKQVR